MGQFLADGFGDVSEEWMKNFFIMFCALVALWDKFRTKPPVVPDPVRTKKADVYATTEAVTAVEERVEKKIDALTVGLSALPNTLMEMERRMLAQGEARLEKLQTLFQQRAGAMEARVNTLAETLAAVRAKSGKV